jgi:very-short-patch-repair endonuclease/transcription elongation GreA/GreB family factor
VSDDKRKDLCNLLSYAEELLRITEKVTSDLSRDAVRVFHEHQIKHLEGISIGVSDDAWLRVARLREIPAPEPDAIFDFWLSNFGSLSEPPRLADKLLVEADLDTASELLVAGLAFEEDIMPQRGDDADPDKVDVILRAENMPEFVALYRAYCVGPWQAWAELERPRRQSILVYNQLFEAHHRMVSAGDDAPIECVWGVGVARWEHPLGRIDVPLIEQGVELDLNELDGAIVVRPRQQPPRVSLRVFDDRGIDSASAVQRDASARLARIVEDPDAGFSPFRRDSFEPILKVCQARLAADSVYEGDISERTEGRASSGGRPLPQPDEILRVTDGWVLYIRQRSVDFRCEDIRRLKSEIEDTSQEGDLPPPAVQLASKPKDTRVSGDAIDLRQRGMPEAPAVRSGGQGGASEGGGSSAPAASDEIVFLPLQYNDEQAEIIARLDREGTAGVVVQGPPGTGKTHTIANIMCHYMARGMRVLVTARTPEALTAIQSKLPEEIRQLAISVIHSDREGARQLEEAVGVLAQTVAHTDRHELNRERVDKERRLFDVRSKISDLDRKIRAYAEQNLQPVRFRGEELLPMALSAALEAERAEHAWLPDGLDLDARFEARFGDGEVAEARAIRTRLGSDIVYPAAALPDPAALPDTARILGAHAALVQDAENDARAVRGDLPYVALTIPNAGDLIRQTHAWLEGLAGWLDEVGAGGHEWVLVAYQILLEAKPAEPAARQTLRTLLAEWVRLQAEGRGYALLGIETPCPPGDATFDAAVEKLARGEKPFGFFGGSALKGQLAEVRVAGNAPSAKPPADQDAWKHVRGWRRWQKEAQGFIGRWNAASRVLGLAALPADFQAGCEELLRLGSLVERCHAFHQDAPHRLTVIAGLFPHGVDAREVVVLGRVEKVSEALAVNLDRSSSREGAELKARLGDLAAVASGLPFQVGLAAIAGTLGSAGTAVHELAEGWNEVLQEAGRLAALRPYRERLDAIAAAVAASGAPFWAEKLAFEPAEDGVEDTLTPPAWRRSWEWARAAGFIARISDRAAVARMSTLRAEREAEQRRLLAEIVRLRTFIGLKQGITEQVASALAKFVAAVRRIGAGTGKSAERHRRASREAALEAATAVPCWILPEWRVAEQLPSELGCFDLVIVDEASQSDITSLPVVLRGKQLLVVGDDKQVSPSAVGIEERTAIQLRETFLKGTPLANFLDPATSLYDIASMTFPGSVTMLREHFRCVEPIIRFSSRFYPKALVPLRLPAASERLDPPLVDVYVPTGRKTRDVNQQEADWIVEEIERVTSDPAMAKRSIGVISLIGDKQAKLIQDALTRRLGTDVLVRHRMMCGNAATFQGQERDVMFLSMVACPETAKAQTMRTIEQRFNVAMSRARDRLYLVRSVRASDLSQRDLKLAIIEHFARPMGEATVAQRTDVLEACDSDFEREVGGRLLRLGYRVRPQVPVAGFRIDFVVEGAQDRRLAIELDGDKYHGPDRWAEDLRRQRALERMGWVFWRCWGSHWLADPNGCMDELLATLRRQGVEPVTGDVSPVEWTRHIVVGAVEEAHAEAETASGAAAPEAAAPEGVVTAARVNGADSVKAEESRDAEEVAADETTERADAEDEGEETIVAPGDIVVVQFADTNQIRKFRLSPDRHAPDEGLVGLAQPIAQALLGSSIDEEIEFSVEGQRRIAIVRQIQKAA